MGGKQAEEERREVVEGGEGGRWGRREVGEEERREVVVGCVSSLPSERLC